MRANEFTIAEGIERLDRGDYTGGKKDLVRYRPPINKGELFRLPGGSRFMYYFDGKPTSSNFRVRIVDPEAPVELTKQPRRQDFYYAFEYDDAMQLYRDSKSVGDGTKPKVIGELSVYDMPFAVKNAYRVGFITVDEDYRGQGIAISMYGIIISVLKKTLVAGDSQTPGGRKNWLNLASIPGCEVVGYLSVQDEAITTQKEPKTTNNYRNKETSEHNAKAGKMIDRIMMVGGEYLGEYRASWGVGVQSILTHVFTFPVTMNKAELRNAVSGSNIKVYGSEWGSGMDTGLIARWVG